MKILLFNDNPVVRKLVALSAQKTKDDLSVVWQVEEIEESGYDLLIIDDGLYSNETFASLKETVTFKTTLLMATRGNAVPAGFDHVINKPFLPTDLVDLFAKIDTDLASKASEEEADLVQQNPVNTQDEPFLDFAPVEDDDFSGGLPSLDEEKLPSVLDREEVQEVRELLEDTETDELPEDEEIMVNGMDDIDFDELDAPQEQEVASEEELFDFEGLELDEKSEEADAPNPPSAPLESSDEIDFGDESMLPDNELLIEDAHSLDDTEVVSDDEALSDEALGDLELKIQEAVGDLELDDFDAEFDDSLVESLTSDDAHMQEMTPAIEEFEGLEGFDELDMLDERELKRAIGEEIEDEPASLNVEALDESAPSTLEATTLSKATAVEGIEALQTLLKALTNEDVAKSLKGLNISININFGDDK